MNLAPAYRVSLWAIVALIAVVLVLTVAVVVLAQSGMLHTLGAALQGPAKEAPLCGSASGACP